MRTKPFRVLVVDDNPADRLICQIALMMDRYAAFEVIEADRGYAGLDSCRANHPDCILLDFNMPDIDGLQFISLLKGDDGDLPCAVVMLTGVGDESIAVRAMKSGTLDYVPKTESITEMLARTVIGAIERFDMRRRIADQQRALEASEFRYRTLVEAVPQLVWLANSAGKIQYANCRWSEYTGLTSLGEFCLEDAVPENDRERFSAAWRGAVASHCGCEIELRVRRRSDSMDRWHLICLAPIEHPLSNTSWLGTATDIEGLKQAEMAILKKQKWESIGLLAGGIAHDFNNLLVGVVGGASLLNEYLPASEDAQSILKTIIRSGERAAHLTSQLLAYSGQGQIFAESLNLSSLVRESCELIGSSIRQGVELSLQTADCMPAIEADAAQIQQVIISLVTNAAEAIPDHRRGVVTVRTYVSNGDTAAHAVLEVQDTGSGMDAETTAKIFDPFFTTKFLGRGLGLAAVQGIVRGAKGQIIVDSTPGEGSIFKVILPIPPARVAIPKLAGAETASRQNSTAAILVIDDEPAVREMITVGLGRAGYEVLAAEDGPSGLAVLQQQQGSISLVLLDLRMPKMGGEEVLKSMRASGIQVPVVICSGYSEQEVQHHFSGCDVSAFIQKPFKVKELARRVNDLLRPDPGSLLQCTDGTGQNAKANRH